MSNVAEAYPWMTETRYLGPAKVLEFDENQERVRLLLLDSPEAVEVWARVAIAGSEELTPGDTALVVGEDVSNMYIIGLLSRSGARPVSSKKLSVSGGGYAATAGPPDEEKLRVFSRRNELVFEYDPNTDKARVNLESGDLEFVTQNGNIAFVSGREIMFHGRSIGMSSNSDILLGIVDAIGKIRSKVTLNRRKMMFDSPEVTVDAQRAEFEIQETSYTGKRLLSKIDCAKFMVDRIESIAQTVIEKAKNVYKTVDELSQLKTGRRRTLVDSTYHFKAKNAFLKSEEDYKIRAEKIHLG